MKKLIILIFIIVIYCSCRNRQAPVFDLDNIRFYNRIWVDPKNTVGHFYTNGLNKQKEQEARLAILNYSDSTISEVAYLKGYSSSTIESDVKNALSSSTKTN